MKYRIRQFSIAWFAVRIAIIAVIVIALLAMSGLCKVPEEPAEVMTAATTSATPEVIEIIEEPEELFFPLTDMERDLVERVVAAEGRGESIEAQMAIAQTIRDRATTRKQTVEQVCLAENQFAAPYMADISEKTKDAVRFVFDNGESIFPDYYVTHFYAWKLIAPPAWTDSFIYLGEIGGTRFYGEAM